MWHTSQLIWRHSASATGIPPASIGRSAPGSRLHEPQSIAICWAASCDGSQFSGDLQRAQVVLAPCPSSNVRECSEASHSACAVANCSGLATGPCGVATGPGVEAGPERFRSPAATCAAINRGPTIRRITTTNTRRSRMVLSLPCRKQNKEKAQGTPTPFPLF